MSPVDQPVGCLTFDVEDYFHIEAAYDRIGPSRWRQWPSRVEANVDHVLGLLAERGVLGTFFVLGDVAQQHPGIVPRIAEAGHEIASHGFMHDRLHRLTPQTFRRDLIASRQLLEDQAGQAVIGYRAPTFSLVRQTAWAIEVLIDAGFRYDASVFPVRHPLYGIPEAPHGPFHLAVTDGAGGVEGQSMGRRLLEIPPLTWSVAGRNVPVAGGGYFRLLPLWFMEQGLRQAAAQGRPAVLYFHPWEFDPGLPAMPLRWYNRLRTYTGLSRTTGRLRAILAHRCQWMRMVDALGRFRDLADDTPPLILPLAEQGAVKAGPPPGTAERSAA